MAKNNLAGTIKKILTNENASDKESACDNKVSENNDASDIALKNNVLSENINVVYGQTNKNLLIKDHFHNSLEMIYVVDGSAEFEINNKFYTVTKNNIVLISNLETHSLKVLSYPYRRYFILIKPEYFKSAITEPEMASIFIHRPEHFRHVLELREENQQNIQNIIKNIHNEVNTKNDYWEVNIKSYLQLLFVDLYRNYKNAFPLSELSDVTKTIIEIQRYVDAHYLEPLSFKDICRKYFVSMYYISHNFKKVTGYSFRDYVILQRISKAKDLLFYTDDDIMQVGISSGFYNVNNFIRTFKKYTGITPYQYRKKFKFL